MQVWVDHGASLSMWSIWGFMGFSGSLINFEAYQEDPWRSMLVGFLMEFPWDSHEKSQEDSHDNLSRTIYIHEITNGPNRRGETFFHESSMRFAGSTVELHDLLHASVLSVCLKYTFRAPWSYPSTTPSSTTEFGGSP